MSRVFQNIDPPSPSPPCECVLPRERVPLPLLGRGGGGGGGQESGHTRQGERGVGVNIFWKTRDIGLPSYILRSWVKYSTWKK
jgi:hypothetical protein